MAIKRKTAPAAQPAPASPAPATDGLGFLNNLVDQHATVVDKKKKGSAAPAIVPTADIETHVEAYSKYKKDMKDNEGKMRIEEAPIKQFCLQKLDEKALAGEFVPTWDLASKHGILKFITVDKFSLDLKNLPKIKAVLGDDNYKQVIIENPVMTLKAEVFTDQALATELQSKLGNDFLKFFDIEKKIEVKKGFNTEIFKIAKTADRLNEIRSLIVPTSPSLK